MAFIFDNLTANVIAMTVILIMASIQMRSTRQQVARTSQQMVRDQARTLTAWLEKDLGEGVRGPDGEIGGIGKNMDPDENALETLLPDDDCENNWYTDEFVFKWERDDGKMVWVQYKTEKEGGVYSLTRRQKEKSPGSGEPDWNVGVQGRASGLKYFDVDLLKEDGSCTTIDESNDDVRSVRVRFSIKAPFQNEELAFSASRANTVVARYPLGGP